MDIATAASYLKDPWVFIGFILFLAFLTTRQLVKSGLIGTPSNSPGSRMLKLTLKHGFVLGLLIVAMGVYLKYPGLPAVASSRESSAAQNETKSEPREIDYGFVELDPELPVPIPSYKNGGTVVLYAGDTLRFQAFSIDTIPPLELHAGKTVHKLPGTKGEVIITGPTNQPLPAVLLARGQRRSLPGSAPPRISVKVQVLGTRHADR